MKHKVGTEVLTYRLAKVRRQPNTLKDRPVEDTSWGVLVVCPVIHSRWPTVGRSQTPLIAFLEFVVQDPPESALVSRLSRLVLFLASLATGKKELARREGSRAFRLKQEGPQRSLYACEIVSLTVGGLQLIGTAQYRCISSTTLT